MTRTAIGFCVAAAFGMAASVGAQSPTTAGQTAMSHDKDITLTGCLQRGADGNYMLTNVQMGKDMGSTGSTTGTTGTATSGTTATAGASTSATMAKNTWALEGGTDLDKHVGHKIEVTGKADTSGRDEAATTGTTGTATSGQTTSSQREMHPTLDVSTVKMIASTCS